MRRDAGDRIPFSYLGLSSLYCFTWSNMTVATAPITGADWYDNLSNQDQELYDMIEYRCPEFEKLEHGQCQEFMDELSEYGITTAQQFEDAYFMQFSYAHDESHFGEFVEYIVTELNDQVLPEFLVIDWQASWYRNYRHDFFSIEFDGEVYFFSAHF